MKDKHISILVLKDCISIQEAIESTSYTFSSIAEFHIYDFERDNAGVIHCKLLAMNQLDSFAMWLTHGFVLKSIFLSYLVESRDILT